MHPTEQDNIAVWDGRSRGWYEVWYYKLNDPAAGTAVWLRSTILVPLLGHGEPVAELWAIAFDKNDPAWNCAFKRRTPLAGATLGRDAFSVAIAGATLTQTASRGAIGDGAADGIAWDLSVTPAAATFRHFPSALMYRLPFPRTKVLAPNLSCTYTGTVTVKGRTLAFDRAIGHQAHIWGTKHAARWAWANCAAFDDAPEGGAVLEALTAQIKVGGRLAPPLTVLCLRCGGEELLFNALRNLATNRSAYDLTRWDLEGENAAHAVRASITNDPRDMVGVGYRDPDGETRVCHNTKVAGVTVSLYEKARGGRRLLRTLASKAACAYEVVEPSAAPGVRVLI